MKQQIFAVRDIKANTFFTPNFQHSKGEAIRAFADAVNNDEKNNLLNTHPEDFEMYHLGEYDTDTGKITPIDPSQLITATECKKTK